MGWETAVTSAFNAISAVNKTNQGMASAKAIVQQGEQEASNIADNTKRAAGTLQTSFLQSGIVLDQNSDASKIVAQAFAKGTTDINRTISNTNAAAKNTFNAARTQALEELATGLTKSGMLKKAGSWLDDNTGDLWNGMGQDFGSALDPSPVGPYMSPLSLSYYK